MNGICDILCQPETHVSLKTVNENGREFLIADNGVEYPLEDGIICFLNGDLTGNNKTYQKLYNRLAPLYDASTRVYALFKGGGEKKRVMQYMSELNAEDGDKVLEISIGTGRNIAYLNQKALFFGVDISMGMLKVCGKKMKKFKRDIVLIQAEAERLPLKDNSFDVVFSAGGFNFYSDRKKAALEMIRVAKPGSKLMIYDETEKVRKKYKKAPVSGSFYKAEITDPVEFIPKTCSGITYKEICNGELYVLSFIKPLN
jgi:ubiquinone/menaquinone biosynthesis C-methylase UbiE